MSAKNPAPKLWSTPLNKDLSKRVGARQIRKKGAENTHFTYIFTHYAYQ
jgi:hypothetical protein